MSVERRTVLKAMGVAAMALATNVFATEEETHKAVFELRVYHTVDGRLPALLARFRDHTEDLFRRHGMTSVSYWTPVDEPLKAKTLIYILRHPSREEATKNWAAFQGDPEWLRVKSESEASGPIVEKIDSTFMESTDFSPRL